MLSDIMLDLALRESMGDVITLTELLSFIKTMRFALCEVCQEWLTALRMAHSDNASIKWESFSTPKPYPGGIA